MNLNAIRTNWAALQSTTGLGPIYNDEGYARMVALADALIDSGLAGDGGELSGLFALVSGLIADYDDTQHVLPSALGLGNSGRTQNAQYAPDCRFGGALWCECRRIY